MGSSAILYVCSWAVCSVTKGGGEVKRIVLLVGVMVLLLAIPLAVAAQGPGPPEDPGPPENAVFATIDYVDQLIGAVYAYVNQQIADLLAYVDGQIATVLDHVGQEVARLDAKIDGIGGGGGETFDVPAATDLLLRYDKWPDGAATVIVHPYPCRWHDIDIASQVQTRAELRIAGAEGSEYGVGRCQDTWPHFENAPALNAGDEVNVDIVYWWMGISKELGLAGTCQITYDVPPFLQVSCPLTERTP